MPDNIKYDALFDPASRGLAGYRNREQLKVSAWARVRDENLTVEERAYCAELILDAWFWRSAEANHPTYPAYVAMILNQDAHHFPADVTKILLDRYGKREGIEHGTYYHG